jgi:hypothetical protein
LRQAGASVVCENKPWAEFVSSIQSYVADIVGVAKENTRDESQSSNIAPAEVEHVQPKLPAKLKSSPMKVPVKRSEPVHIDPVVEQVLKQ